MKVKVRQIPPNSEPANPPEYWGFHLMVDSKGCDLNKMKNKKYVIKFIKTLVERIDMTPVGEPFIKYSGEGTDKEGFSVAQLIITSSITAHFVNPEQKIYIDFLVRNLITKKYYNIYLNTSSLLI